MTLYKGSQAIENLYMGSQAISEVYYGSQLVYSSGVWLTVNTTPSNATVTFNTTGKVDGNRIRVKKGTSVSYTISASGYYTQTGTVTVNNDHIINVELEQQFYQDGEVLFENGVGGITSSITPKTTGVYEIICIAGGGGAAVKRSTASQHPSYYQIAAGGSGSGFQITIRLLKDSAYKITVGKGGSGVVGITNNTVHQAGTGTNSSFAASTAYAGGGGAVSNQDYTVVGAAGAIPSLTFSLLSTTFNSAGNTGSSLIGSLGTAAGGAALYGTYGKGGDGTLTSKNAGTAENGNDGYVKVTFLHR